MVQNLEKNMHFKTCIIDFLTSALFMKKYKKNKRTKKIVAYSLFEKDLRNSIIGLLWHKIIKCYFY